jgi:hypothetical protein
MLAPSRSVVGLRWPPFSNPGYTGRATELLVTQTGWTLHQFRHSALTHLAEDNVQLPLLMTRAAT